MKITDVDIARGHLLLGLSDGRWAYVQGEMVLGMKFYADYRGKWYWIRKPKGTIYLLADDDVIAPMGDADKDALSAAIKEYFRDTKYRVIVD